MQQPTIAAIAATTIVAVAPAAVAAQTPVTACGQIVSGSAVLTGDLNCTGFVGAAVVVASGKLDLAGFTLTGGDDEAVLCETTCSLFSDPPGAVITGAGADGITGGVGGPSGITQVKLRDVTVAGNGGDGVRATRISISDATIDGNGGIGVNGLSTTSVVAGRAKLRRVTITNNGADGASALNKLTIKESTVTGNAAAGLTTFQQSLKAKGSTISGNGEGIRGDLGRLKILDCTVDANLAGGITSTIDAPSNLVARTTLDGNLGRGITDGNYKLRDVTVANSGDIGVLVGNTTALLRVTISGSALHGLHGRELVIKDSTLLGNGVSPDCGVSVTCADLATSISLNTPGPKLLGSTVCGTSYNYNSGFPGSSYGICSLD